MENNLSDLARPLQIHIGYINAILSRREGDVDRGYLDPLNEFDYSAGEIFLHGINGLYRAIQTYNDPESNFNDHNITRLQLLSIKEELMQLYVNTVDDFVNLLSKLPLNQKDSMILSPINGNETSIHDWFSTCVMHTIHHIGQSLRIHGMVLKKDNQVKFERKSTPSYQIIK